MSSDEETGIFITARLDEEQHRAETMEHFAVFEQPYYSCAGSRTKPYGDLEWGEEHCDCFLAARKAKRLREIAAMRALVDLADDAYYEADHYAYHGIRRILAAIWNDHPDYRDWKP